MIQDLGQHHFQNQYHPEKKPGKEDYFLSFSGKSVLVRRESGKKVDPSDAIMSGDGLSLRCPEGEGFSFYKIKEYLSSFPKEKEEVQENALSRKGEQQAMGNDWRKSFTYLFSLDGQDYYLLKDIVEFGEYLSLEELRREFKGPKSLLFLANTGMHLFHFYQKHRYCGVCGTKMEKDQRERAMRCPNCQEVYYPKIMPAVIVGIIHKDKILCTRYANRLSYLPALVAGFIEIGETAEEAAIREAMEETGVPIKEVKYYKSQPWGMADDLLLGYFAKVDEEKTSFTTTGEVQIIRDEEELSEAVWLSRDEVELQGNDFSLTNEMMRTFKEGKFELHGRRNG